MTAPDADGWIEWSGGRCPVAGNKLVEVRMGQKKPEVSDPDHASWWMWQHTSEAVMRDYQITAYRVLT